MKAKYLGEHTCLYTTGKIYEVNEFETRPTRWEVTADDGQKYLPMRNRFELMHENPIEEKQKQIQEARKTLEEQKQKIDLLEKELADLNTPKVGDKYEHRYGGNYVLARMADQYALVCYEHDGIDLGYCYYGPCESINDVFGNFKHYFTKIS